MLWTRIPIGNIARKEKITPSWLLCGFNLLFYTKSIKMTKEYVFQKFNNDFNLMPYLPDNVQLTSLTREFLLSI